jgi:hypothetical protein
MNRALSAARCIVVTALLSAAVAPQVFGLSFIVTGAWTLEIGADDLAGTTGSDFVSTHLAAVDELVIEVSEAVDQFEQWYIDAHIVETNWPAGCSLEVVRTSDGAGIGTISGGTTLLTLGDTAAPFFEGTGNRTSVFVRIVLTGMTVVVGADLYIADIVFTLRDVN